MLEAVGLGQTQGRVKVDIGEVVQLLNGRPDRVAIQPVAPGVQLFRAQAVVAVTGLHVQHHAVDQLLQAGNGTGHRAGGHVLADQYIQQPILIEVVGSLDEVHKALIFQVLIVGHTFVQIHREHCVTHGFVELRVDFSRHDCSLNTRK
nr:hypothetical protein [Pseudomonas sp. PDM28]